MKLLILRGIVLSLLAVASPQFGHGQPANPPLAPNPAAQAAQPRAPGGTTANEALRQQPDATLAQATGAASAPAPSSEPPATPALDLMLVLDNSGSMRQNDPQMLTREVVTRFLDGIDANTRLGMIIFDQNARLIEPMTVLDSLSAKVRFLKGLESLNYRGRYTNSPAAIERALYELKTHGRGEADKIVIFLTDGIVDTGDQARDREREQWLKNNLTAESRKLGIRLFTIAFTDEADYQLIQTLAQKTEGEYFRAYRPEEIERVFQAIQQRLVAPLPASVEVVAPAQPPPADSPPTPPSPRPDAPSLPPDAPSPPPSSRLPLPLLLAGVIALVGIVALVLVMRRGARGRAQVGGPAPAVGAVGEPPLPQAELLDLKGAVFQGPVRLTQRRTRIGRTPENDIVIPGEGVSALHATIEYQDGAFYLEDQRSSNGTWLNDDRKRLEPHHPVRLKSGDRIRFDAYELKFLAAQQPSVGGTILAQDRTQGPTGTILTQPGADAPETAPELDATAPRETQLKPDMCPNHAALKATELCGVCQRAFCTLCVDEIEGKTVCKACQGQQAQPGLAASS